MIRNIGLFRPGTQFCTLALLAVTWPVAGFCLDTERAEIQAFVTSLVTKHGFEQNYVLSVLNESESQQKILDAISRPAEKTKPWHEYRAIFVTPKRIDAGLAFWAEHDVRLARIAERTGVPAEIIAAIVGVETFYGQITGNYRVVDALATLAFDYPPRSRFFRSELEEFFLLAREEQLDVVAINGSYAGAMGPPQFIPSSYRNFAVDGDGDGRRDLLGNWDDILTSVANYFVAHSWAPGQPVASPVSLSADATAPNRNTLKATETVGSLIDRGIAFETELDSAAPAQLISLQGATGPEYWIGFHNFYVITRYNRSVMYALAVHQLGESLAEARLVGTGNRPMVSLQP